MIQLATTAQIFQRLGIASPTADQSASADAFRLAIEERVLALTGFLVTDDPYFAPSQQTDEQIDVQLGISRLMRYRPLIPMSSNPQRTCILQARSLASDNFNTILGDIRDLKTGRIMPLASELTPVFPPVGGLAPWFRWRQMIWPVVRFTYLVDPLGSPTNPVPVSLNRAVVEWVASIISRPLGGILQSQSFSAEKISESLSFHQLWNIPPLVNALLAAYTRGRGNLIF